MADSQLQDFDISTEEWREYDWQDAGSDRRYQYRVTNPKTLFFRPGGTTHRVVDHLGVAHCVPAVGQSGCVLRWKNFDTSKPVNF